MDSQYQQGESLKHIAGDDVDPVSVWNHLRARGIKLRNKIEAQIVAVSKYPKTSFAGSDVERAYILGLRMGDLNVVRHGRAIRTRVSTTHPAMIELFTEIFEKYGHIHKYPKKSGLTGFEWALECDLDSSFGFLLDLDADLGKILKSEFTFIAFLAGFFDADGSVFYHRKGARGGFEFSLTNMNEQLLRFISERLSLMGFSPVLRLAPQQSDRGVKNGADSIWRLSLWRYEEIVRILRMLPIRHREKRAKVNLALRLGYRPRYEERIPLIRQWDDLGAATKRETKACIAGAEMSFELKTTPND